LHFSSTILTNYLVLSLTIILTLILLHQARVGIMDASLPGSKAVLAGEGIDGYPYIAAYRKGAKVGIFGGPRTGR
jgi:hypothetical protein